MPKAMGWHERRFEQRPNTIHKTCTECGCDMWLPASKAAAYHRCGPACNKRWRERTRAGFKVCETCGAEFRPRPIQVKNGHGRFCSQKCNTALRKAGLAPEVISRRLATMAEKRAAGQINYKSGPDNPAWKGGYHAMMLRLQESGKLAERLRDYRRRNPDKVREFTARRAGRKLGRLQYGTIPALRKLQRNKCAICKASIASQYHVDHIVPLALGGKHDRANIQLLCPPCNLAKSSRDPIEHMQSLGRLL